MNGLYKSKSLCWVNLLSFAFRTRSTASVQLQPRKSVKRVNQAGGLFPIQEPSALVLHR